MLAGCERRERVEGVLVMAEERERVEGWEERREEQFSHYLNQLNKNEW